MQNTLIKNGLNHLLLIGIALSSGCAPSTVIDSPTATSQPTQVLVNTLTPVPTNTPEPIHPTGTIFYNSGFHTLYSFDLQTQESKEVFQNSGNHLIVNNFIYATVLDEKNKDQEVFKANIDGTHQEQLSTDGAIEVESIDPTNHYLTYNDKKRGLILLDLVHKKPQLIAEPKKNDKSIEWLEWVFTRAWSPDGKKLIYEKIIGPGGLDICTLFIYDVDKKESTPLLPDEKNDCSVTFSPTGADILLLANKNQKSEFIILNLASGNIQRIQLDGYVLSYKKCPDGKKMLLEVTDKDKSLKLFLFSWESKQVDLILNLGYLQGLQALSWSPDGNKVLLQQYEPSLSYKKSLRLLDINTKKIADLYTLKGYADRKETDYFWNYDPIWSPDGKYFAYLTMSSFVSHWEENDKFSTFLNIQSVESMNSTQMELPRFVSIRDWVYPTK